MRKSIQRLIRQRLQDDAETRIEAFVRKVGLPGDVVRFDGITHYWQAMVAVRPVAGELAGESPDVLAALRADCERRLRSWTAADGTMRIPVEVVLLLAGVEATP